MQGFRKAVLGVINVFHRSYSVVRHCSKVASLQEPTWDLFGAIVVERKPVITKELEDVEKRFSSLLQQLEFEKSLKSDHEVTDEREKREADLIKKGKIKDIDLDAVTKQTAQDFKDLCKEELARFKFAPRLTEEDKKKDLKSLNRLLDGHLLLFIEHQLGNNFNWIVPQAKHVEGEALHETALRALEENCGQQLKVRMLGRAPWGFYKYKYPKEIRARGSTGAKVFFFKATYLSGNVQLVPERNKDFKWMDSNSVFDIKPLEYSDSISQFLLNHRN
ncbi:39S ribosomal protein L46, mitochondrial [Ischnura elegans]|uniref:39S ribosomal protein L46, mitochondrial n=1 Tax=Ischnura elegans TaxID=197161 RepID=UPI001ED87EED|nr:39S ribosomal protein L46, mitochondrial [Ischnura elegans]